MRNNLRSLTNPVAVSRILLLFVIINACITADAAAPAQKYASNKSNPQPFKIAVATYEANPTVVMAPDSTK